MNQNERKIKEEPEEMVGKEINKDTAIERDKGEVKERNSEKGEERR